MKKRVGFEALVKQVDIKSLVSGDKQARLTLEFDASDDKLMNDINALHRADDTIFVVIMEKPGKGEAEA